VYEGVYTPEYPEPWAHSNREAGVELQGIIQECHADGTQRHMEIQVHITVLHVAFREPLLNKYACMRASQFINEAVDSDAVNELDSYINNNEDLYSRRFMPIISNIKRKMAKGVYDHEKAQTLGCT
jgi:hypothetical protein